MLFYIVSRQYSLTENFFDQQKDHTDYSSYDKYPQPYFTLNAFYEEGKPVIIFLADAAQCGNPNEVNGKLVDIAQRLRAGLVVLQMRGQEEFIEGQVSKVQLLEDVKEFTKYYRMMSNARSVIAIGANAFGDLAAGLRQNYQSYFDAAIAVDSFDCFDEVYENGLDQLDNQTFFELVGNRKMFNSEQCKKLIGNKKKINENYRAELQTKATVQPPSLNYLYVCALQADSQSVQDRCGEMYDGLPLRDDIANEIHGKDGKIQMGIFDFKVKPGTKQSQHCQFGDYAGAIELLDVDEVANTVNNWLELRGLLEGSQ